MNAEPYDVSRLASLAIHFVLASGAGVEDAIRALELAERMLRQAQDDERGHTGKDADPQLPALH
jgi:hypothetical protein